MRKKIVAGNWKLNKTKEEAIDLVRQIVTKSAYLKKEECTVIIAPPYPFITLASEIAEGNKNVFIAAQDCSRFEEGGYTGEVSASMLASVGVKYIILGHSERR